MDAAEYKSARKQLGLYNVQLARKLGVNGRTAHRYESAEQRIPEPVARLLRMYLKHGIPRGW
jgi:DNA-binding transcriptional regulator YiaG